MTKTEKDNLHSAKCAINQIDLQSDKGAQTRYVVAMSLNKEEIRTLRHVLDDAYNDEVATKLSTYIRNALQQAGIKL